MSLANDVYIIRKI